MVGYSSHRWRGRDKRWRAKLRRNTTMFGPMDNDGIRDRDILDEWTNGERGDTTFPFDFGPMQDQLTMAHVVTFTTMERRINFTWNRDITFLLLGVIGGEVEEAVGGLYFYLFSPFRFPKEKKLLILPTLDSRCFFVLGPPAGDRERQREPTLTDATREGRLFFPLNKRRWRWPCPKISLDRETMWEERRCPHNLTIGYF